MSEHKPLTILESLKQLRKDLQTMVESQASIAILTKARYDALVKIGFTEKQALEIVKARGIMP